MRYKDDGCIEYFTILIGWESILVKICAHWSLEDPLVKVKYFILNVQRTISCISLEGDFMRMYDVHHMFKKNMVDMLVEKVNEVIGGTCRPSMPS